jgi:UDP-N-acetylmuramate dehydrogenase
MTLQENVPLAPLTTFGVGGPARYFVEATSDTEVCDAVNEARSRELRLFVLGGGSNLVVSDAGFPGLVLRIATKGIELEQHSGKAFFEVAAGEDWDGFVAWAVAADCAGVECMSGIPGTVGGTPVQNVGAYGQEVSDVIESVTALDLDRGRTVELCNEACGFAYRKSIFNTTHRGQYIVLKVRFALEPHGAPKIEYADLKHHFAERSSPPTLAETREAVRAIRHRKAMLIVPGDEDCRSAGSFFKNPIVTEKEFAELARRVKDLKLASAPPRFETPAGVKTSAAWLVEKAGFRQGYGKGQVGISRKHTLAIVNRGGASAADILALKNEVQRGVRETFGIELQPEPVFVGFDTEPSVVSRPSSARTKPR